MVAGQQGNLAIGAIIQARMKSMRLPGKILKSLPFPDGKPLLEWVVDGALRSTRVSEVVLATSINPEDDLLESFAKQKSIPIFRGSEDDVHSRFIAVTENHDFDIMVRLTADNPFLDAGLLDEAIERHIVRGNDYTRTVDLPLGMNFEIVTVAKFLKTKNAALTVQDREHVTLFMRNHERFKKEDLHILQGENWKDIRLTIDYPSDFAAASLILQLADPGEWADFQLIKRIKIFAPWLFEVNASNKQQRQNLTLKEELAIALTMARSEGLTRVGEILLSYAKT